jgi:hypothetical protein
MPEMVYIERGGNVARRDSELMRLSHQENCEELLQTFKDGLADTDFTFNFSFAPFSERVKDRFRKYTFAKLLPTVLKHSGETLESAKEKLTLDDKIWKGIVKGSLYPEKNTIYALALTCRLSRQDTNSLLAVCGFSFSAESVRDVVVDYLLTQKIFNEDMRDSALAEYKIETLPIRRDGRAE